MTAKTLSLSFWRTKLKAALDAELVKSIMRAPQWAFQSAVFCR